MRWLKLAVEELYDVVNARQGNRFPRVVKSDLWLHGSRFLHLPNAKVSDRSQPLVFDLFVDASAGSGSLDRLVGHSSQESGA
jgi:hypothetical protein